MFDGVEDDRGTPPRVGSVTPRRHPADDKSLCPAASSVLALKKVGWAVVAGVLPSRRRIDSCGYGYGSNVRRSLHAPVLMIQAEGTSCRSVEAGRVRSTIFLPRTGGGVVFGTKS